MSVNGASNNSGFFGLFISIKVDSYLIFFSKYSSHCFLFDKRVAVYRIVPPAEYSVGPYSRKL